VGTLFLVLRARAQNPAIMFEKVALPLSENDPFLLVWPIMLHAAFQLLLISLELEDSVRL
jgi:hypothetical protein